MRSYNFSVGPSSLPIEVLNEIKENLFEWKDGMGVLEVGCRDQHVLSLIEEVKHLLIDVMSIPETHEVLFLQGGGIAMNSMVPLNLMKRSADYIITGTWSNKSAIEAAKYGTVNTFVSGGSYVHICDNETVDGIEYKELPETYGVPLVADFSSSILTKSIDVSEYGVIYASAQKNLGIAGLTIAIVRKDLIGHAMDITPSVFNWKIVSENNSSYNTPPVFPIYVAGLVLKWIQRSGGVEEIEKRNKLKSDMLYEFVDSSDLYSAPVSLKQRSRINVIINLNDNSYDDFLEEAKKSEIYGLFGSKFLKPHIRVNLYNSISVTDVEYLINFMKKYEHNRQQN